MTRLVQLGVTGGGTVLVEAEDLAPAPVTRGGRREDAVMKAGETLEAVLAKVGPSIAGIAAAIRESTSSPDEVQVEFSVKISTDANVIIARTGGEANFKISLKWAGGDG